MFDAAAMSLSSFSVVMNALRLNLGNFFEKHDKTNKNTVKEGVKMEKTLKIKGMMCPHCEGRVRAALEAVEFIYSVEVSHKKGIAKVTLTADVADTELAAIVEKEGYKVTGIK